MRADRIRAAVQSAKACVDRHRDLERRLSCIALTVAGRRLSSSETETVSALAEPARR
ncbi:hypothetical protein SAMN04488595_11866 [Ralstonia sp. 25mfcol4.1]|nr:hypothetical protein SAMN04488595_11866 [Ralstonia sp. 25mfcol4.1]